MFKRILLPLVLFALGLMSLVVTYRAGHAYQTYVFNSDGLYLPTLFADLFGRGGQLRDWYLTPAPYLFPDALLYLVAYLGGNGPHRQILLFAMFQLTLAGVATAFIARTVSRSNAVLAAVLSVLLLLWLALTSREPFSELLTSAYHGGAFLATLACVALWLTLTDPGRDPGPRARRAMLAAMALLAFLTCLSDNLFLVQTLLPFAATAFLLDARSWRRYRPAALILAAGLLGSASYKLVIARDTRYPASFGLSRLDVNLADLGKIAVDSFTAVPAFGIVFLAMTAWSLALTVRHLRGRSSPLPKPFVWLALFSTLSLVATLLAVLFSSRLQVTPRYLIPVFCWPVILAVLVLVHYLGKLFLPAGLAAGLAVVAVLGIDAHQARGERLSTDTYYNDELACLDAALGAEPGLRHGIAQYWDAKSVQAFSKQQIVLAQYLPSLEEHRWITSSKFFRERYDFAIVATDPASAGGLERARIVKLNGEPRKSAVCDKRTLMIYGPQQLRVLRIAAPGDALAWTGCDLQSLVTKATPACSLRKDDPQQEGVLSYGPYETLPPGRYAFALDFTSTLPRGAYAGNWKVTITIPKGNRTLAGGDLHGTAGAPFTLSGEFTIGTGQTENVEVVTYSAKGGAMGVNALRIRRLE
jgi:hypothetical protein